MIKSNMNFHDFPTPSNYKVTEDLLFILIQSLTLLPNLLCTSDKFGQLFDCYSKSIALNLMLSLEIVNYCKVNFLWNTKPITYLDFKLPTNLKDLYTLNHRPLHTHVIQDLHNWDKSPSSWSGRATILEMNALPRPLYLCQTIPIHFSNPSFSIIQAPFIRFSMEQ